MVKTRTDIFDNPKAGAILLLAARYNFFKKGKKKENLTIRSFQTEIIKTVHNNIHIKISQGRISQLLKLMISRGLLQEENIKRKHNKKIYIPDYELLAKKIISKTNESIIEVKNEGIAYFNKKKLLYEKGEISKKIHPLSLKNTLNMLKEGKDIFLKEEPIEPTLKQLTQLSELIEYYAANQALELVEYKLPPTINQICNDIVNWLLFSQYGSSKEDTDDIFELFKKKGAFIRKTPKNLELSVGFSMLSFKINT